MLLEVSNISHQVSRYIQSRGRDGGRWRAFGIKGHNDLTGEERK